MLSHNSPEVTGALQKDAMRIPRTEVLCWNIRGCSQTLRPTRLNPHTLNGDLHSDDCSGERCAPVPPPGTADENWSEVGGATSISRARQGGGCRETGSHISGEVCVRAHA